MNLWVESLSSDSAVMLARSTERQASISCSDRPVLQRCVSRLPGRTPVLPRRVMSLHLEESEHLSDDTIESLHPYGGLKKPSDPSVDDVKTTRDQQPIPKTSTPSPLGLQITAPSGNQ